MRLHRALVDNQASPCQNHVIFWGVKSLHPLSSPSHYQAARVARKQAGSPGRWDITGIDIPVTLWWTYKKQWKITIFNGKIHYKWSFSIAMLVHQRVQILFICIYITKDITCSTCISRILESGVMYGHTASMHTISRPNSKTQPIVANEPIS